MELLDSSQYQRLKASGQLPSPQGVAFAIIKLLQRDDYRIEDLVHLVQSDPAIAGRLLKFANAAIFGNGRPIVSLSKAVISLGAFRVRDLVLGFSVLHNHRSGDCPGFDYTHFWSRALATAIAAQALARQARVSAEENFTAGLLCDVGELALASLFPQEYSRIHGKYPANVLEQRAAEEAEFGTDHRQLGATMLADWGLPDILVQSCYHCEQPEEAGFTEGSRAHLITTTLHFSRTLARICVAGEKEQWSMVPGLYSLGAQLGIGPDELSRLADQIAARWREWGQTLDIRTRELPPFADLLSAVPPAETIQQGEADNLHRRLALIVGQPTDASVLHTQLAGAGYQVQAVPNGGDGLMVALRETPQLILIDVNCPELDAVAFAHALRESPLGREAVLLLVGPECEQDRLLIGVEAGGDDLLVTPMTPQILSARLHAIGRLVQLREEIRRQRQDTVDSAQEWAGSRRRLLQVAMTDPLTRLANRRHGMDFLAAELNFARSNNLPLSCLMADIDHFKLVNDDLGHDAGDQVLAAVARLLQTNARSEDLVFRYGGEEFCIVCPGCSRADVWTIAERMRAAVAAEVMNLSLNHRHVTISIGCAELDPGHQTPDDLIRDADKALYRAKQAGRNRVEG
ncbi:MAG TPA: diguanylate cyclase [Rhodocyclaceae bacterium]|nr:diguanylate cyclase [Rhodocyclaceae bacterium]